MKKISKIIWSIIVAVCSGWMFKMFYMICGLPFWRNDELGTIMCDNFIEYLAYNRLGIFLAIESFLICFIFVVIGVSLIKNGSTKSEG